MNRSLRKTHFRVLAVLAPVAAVTLAASIVVRKPVPLIPMPAPVAPARIAGLREVSRQAIRAEGLTVTLRQFAGEQGTVLELTPLGEPHVPDLLVYLGPGESDAFPGNALLLGAIPGAEAVQFPVPDSAGGRSELFLYSGATHTVLAHVDLAASGRVTP